MKSYIKVLHQIWKIKSIRALWKPKMCAPCVISLQKCHKHEPELRESNVCPGRWFRGAHTCFSGKCENLSLVPGYQDGGRNLTSQDYLDFWHTVTHLHWHAQAHTSHTHIGTHLHTHKHTCTHISMCNKWNIYFFKVRVLNISKWSLSVTRQPHHLTWRNRVDP